jgi:hypothetical protein
MKYVNGLFSYAGMKRDVFNQLTTGLMGELSGFGGLVVSALASGTQVRGFKPGRSRRIFRAKKKTFLRRGSKAVGSMSQLCGV